VDDVCLDLRRREVEAIETQAAIAQAHFDLVLEDRERARQAYETDMRVKEMALQEQRRRAEAAERAEAREVERMEAGRRLMELLERGDVRSEDEAELRRLLAGAKAPDFVPDSMTVPPDDPTHD
jgi:hypothetical protein